MQRSQLGSLIKKILIYSVKQANKQKTNNVGPNKPFVIIRVTMFHSAGKSVHILGRIKSFLNPCLAYLFV